MPVIGRTCIERLSLAPTFVRAAYLRVGERPRELTTISLAGILGERTLRFSFNGQEPAVRLAGWLTGR
jgi:hypothetical protein